MSIKYTGTSTFFIYGHTETLPACYLSGTLESVTDADVHFQRWQLRQEGGEVLEFFLEKPHPVRLRHSVAVALQGKNFTPLLRSAPK